MSDREVKVNLKEVRVNLDKVSSRSTMLKLVLKKNKYFKLNLLKVELKSYFRVKMSKYHNIKYIP